MRPTHVPISNFPCWSQICSFAPYVLSSNSFTHRQIDWKENRVFSGLLMSVTLRIAEWKGLHWFALLDTKKDDTFFVASFQAQFWSWSRPRPYSSTAKRTSRSSSIRSCPSCRSSWSASPLTSSVSTDINEGLTTEKGGKNVLFPMLAVTTNNV